MKVSRIGGNEHAVRSHWTRPRDALSVSAPALKGYRDTVPEFLPAAAHFTSGHLDSAPPHARGKSGS